MDIQNVKFVHVCEACGVSLILSPSEAYDAGWDYPPSMGAWGVVSPRTCGDCAIDETLWWVLVVKKQAVADLNERQLETMARILGEPEFVKSLLG